MKNRIQLIGNLGADPEIKALDKGGLLAKFSLATSDSYKNSDGEKVTDTQWHHVIAWGNLAKITEQFLKKGSEVAIEGKLQHRSYEDKEGQKRFISEIVAADLLMLRKPGNNKS